MTHEQIKNLLKELRIETGHKIGDVVKDEDIDRAANCLFISLNNGEYAVVSAACVKCGKYPFMPGCKTESGSYLASQFCECSNVGTVVAATPNRNWWDVRATLAVECIDGKLKCPFTQKACIMNDTAAFSSCPSCFNNPHKAQANWTDYC